MEQKQVKKGGDQCSFQSMSVYKPTQKKWNKTIFDNYSDLFNYIPLTQIACAATKTTVRVSIHTTYQYQNIILFYLKLCVVSCFSVSRNICSSVQTFDLILLNMTLTWLLSIHEDNIIIIVVRNNRLLY